MPNYINQIIYAVIVVAIAGGALGLAYHLIKKMIDSYSESTQKEVNYIKTHYVEEEKHVLLCENNALKVQQIFMDCFKQHQDAMFKKIRELQESNERQMKLVKDELNHKIENLQTP